MSSPASMKFVGAVTGNQSFCTAAGKFGFDPSILISLIFPIVAEMLKGCLIPPTQQVKMVKGQGTVVKAVIDRATHQALKQLSTKTFGVPGNYTTSDVKSVARPCLEEAVKLSNSELAALLRG